MRCHILPPKIADELAGLVNHPPRMDESFRDKRASLVQYTGPAPGIYTANSQEVEPGTKLAMPYTDRAAIEADAGMTGTETCLTILGEKVPTRVCTVHYGKNYDNAFYDGEQMVCGDGDGQYFNRFTIDEDIIAHEIGHGVTGDLLNYQDQAGALNESLSDCLGALVRQYMKGLKLEDPEAWLIGSNLFLSERYGRALRDMLNPGTAYDNPYFGRDDQPNHMSGYDNTKEDNGGVHTNSGIPNRAFALASIATGSSFDTFRVWRRALITVKDPNCTFEKFAKATVVYASDAQRMEILKAWQDVGVLKAGDPIPPTTGGDGGANAPSFPGADSEVDSRILHAAGGRENVSRWLNHHFRSYFRIKP